MTTTRWITLVLFIVILAACYLPWFDQPGAALRTGLLDTAEWITLSPTARASTPPLLASLPLRLTLALVVVALAGETALTHSTGMRIAFGAAALAAFVTLFPSLEFFTGGSADPNYRQQLLVFVIVLAGIGLIAVLPHHIRWWLQVGLLIIAGGCGIWGLLEGTAFFQAFALSPAPGIGAILFHAALVIIVIRKIAGQTSAGQHSI